MSLRDYRSADMSAIYQEVVREQTNKAVKKEAERRKKVHHRYIFVIVIFAVVAISLCSIFRDIGYQSGYDAAGTEQNIERSSSDRYDVGYREGHDAGYEEGYQKGESDGYDQGSQDGYERAQREYRSSSHSSSSSSSYSGSTRDGPIANAYIGNRNTKKFHLPTCSYLPDQANQVTFATREDAIAAGYDPCGHCHP